MKIRLWALTGLLLVCLFAFSRLKFHPFRTAYSNVSAVPPAKTVTIYAPDVTYLALPPPANLPNRFSRINIPPAGISLDYPQVWGTPEAQLEIYNQSTTSGYGSIINLNYADYSGNSSGFVWINFTSPGFRAFNHLDPFMCPGKRQTGDRLNTGIFYYDCRYFADVALPYSLTAFFDVAEGSDTLYVTANIRLPGSEFSDLNLTFVPPDLNRAVNRSDVRELSGQIFTGSGLSATDSALLKDFTRLVKSVRLTKK